ncbi:hypothetical protein [Cyclobacterium plantarum]|uniref:Uncharacterized protein n=1 Tax=Cyclobacterium plantarum TaxID=2716263 RepID=A0ABX0HA69_9BACT|nr:hypothetical protein [Cyclobacterium plantarum]NHE58746.1 hypothetical protein [Cyclobacterium plantarum]
MTVEELAQYLSSKKPGFQTQNGLSIYLIDGSICSNYDFEIEELEFSFNLFTEEESLHEFIEGFRIQNINDFEALGYNNSWIRYLNREADMEVTQMEFEEGPLCFRLHKMKTLVFSASLHFYDEVYDHLTLPEDFISYFFKNKSKIATAMANRYQF